MKKILIVYENFKELKELYEIACKVGDFITILSPSLLYKDKNSLKFLNSLTNNNLNVVYLKSKKDINFSKISKLNKFLIINNLRKEIEKLILFNEYNIILSGVQTIFSRMLYKYAKRKQIPFFVYHRHLIFSSPFNSKRIIIGNKLFKFIVKYLDMEEFFIDIPNVGFGDKYFVLGEVNKDYLVKNGINEHNIYITGSLEYDIILEKLNLNNKKIDNNKFNVVFITSAFEWVKEYKKEKEQQERIINLINYIKNSPEISLTIRVHPRENYDKYYKLKEKYPFISLEFPGKNSIIEDLSKYDLIIGWLSTAMFEISLLNKKVLFYLSEKDLKEYNSILKFIPKEAIVTNINDIKNLKEAGININIQKIIYFKKNEKAIDRIVNIINKELKC